MLLICSRDKIVVVVVPNPRWLCFFLIILYLNEMWCSLQRIWCEISTIINAVYGQCYFSLLCYQENVICLTNLSLPRNQWIFWRKKKYHQYHIKFQTITLFSFCWFKTCNLILSVNIGLFYFEQVDSKGFRKPFILLQWMGMNALIVYALAACELFPAAMQGFYWRSPSNNLVCIFAS